MCSIYPKQYHAECNFIGFSNEIDEVNINTAELEHTVARIRRLAYVANNGERHPNHYVESFVSMNAHSSVCMVHEYNNALEKFECR